MTNFENSELAYLVEQFDRIKSDCSKRIMRDNVIQWMQSADLEVLGAIYSFCTNPQYYKKIEPALNADDYYRFIKQYFKRCIIENPSGEWTDTRYEAGWSFVGWFKNYWKDKSVPREYLVELKDWLAEIYLAGDDDIRLCISTAVLEHLFDNKRISMFFSDWENDATLKHAFDEAMGRAGKIVGPA